MTDKNVTGGSAPPYNQNPIPSNPRTAYEPTSPPPQAFSPQYPQHPTQPQPQHDIPPYQAPDATHNQQPQPQPAPQYTEQKGSYYGAGQDHGQQQGIPMQGLGQVGGAGAQYQTAVPLQSLGEGVAPVDCPCCRNRALTRTEYVSGNTNM